MGVSEGPKRIQRKRSAGWRMPAGAIYVGRPTRWGNPFPAARPRTAGTDGYAVKRFREECTDLREMARQELRGKDLACWCPDWGICHADVLIEWANS